MASGQAAGKGRRRTSRKRAHATVVVDPEERRHLIEDCAFFRADRFRPARPGSIRRADVKAATADIDAILGAPRKGRKK